MKYILAAMLMAASTSVSFAQQQGSHGFGVTAPLGTGSAFRHSADAGYARAVEDARNGNLTNLTSRTNVVYTEVGTNNINIDGDGNNLDSEQDNDIEDVTAETDGEINVNEHQE